MLDALLETVGLLGLVISVVAHCRVALGDPAPRPAEAGRARLR